MKNQVKIVNLTLLNKIVDYSEIFIHYFHIWLLSLSSDYFFNPTQETRIHKCFIQPNEVQIQPKQISQSSCTNNHLPTKPAKHPNQKHHQKIEARFTYLFRSVFPFIISTCRPQTTPAKMASSDNTTNHL